MLFLVGILALLFVGWLFMRELKKNRKDPIVEENKERGQRFRIIEKQVALRHALRKGFDPKQYEIEQLIEQYKEDIKEEGLQAAMKEFGITREEAISQGFDRGGRVYVAAESRRRGKIQELGREISWQEYAEMDSIRIRDWKPSGPDCWTFEELEEFLQGKEFPPDRTAHLEFCFDCNILVTAMKPDPEMQKPSGPECITKDELANIGEAGVLANDRHNHLSVCKRCKYDVWGAQEKFIKKMVPERLSAN